MKKLKETNSCAKCDLSRANLSSAELGHAILAKADLTYANLSGANLDTAYMPAAKLISANLTGAKLNGACLDGAYFNEADLTGANLSGATYKDADFSGAIRTNGIKCAAGSIGSCKIAPYLSGVRSLNFDIPVRNGFSYFLSFRGAPWLSFRGAERREIFQSISSKDFSHAVEMTKKEGLGGFEMTY